jgi:uncharacterized membrane protein YhaH (DUF805 family)
MNTYLDVLTKKYATTTGRARRREYWTFVLINLVIVIVLGFVESMLGLFRDSQQSILGLIFQLAVLVPTIAVSIRRMHDTDHSGWWVLVPIVNLIFALTGGTKGENRFGPDPKAAAAAM